MRPLASCMSPMEGSDVLSPVHLLLTMSVYEAAFHLCSRGWVLYQSSTLSAKDQKLSDFDQKQNPGFKKKKKKKSRIYKTSCKKK